MDKKVKMIIASLFGFGIILILCVVLGLFNNKTYIVGFDTNGGSYVPAILVKSGERVNKPTNPIKDGFLFEYWKYKDMEYDFTSEIEENITLEAVWVESNDIIYTITFTVDGNTEILEVSSVDEINLEELNFEEKDGYLLKWYVDGKEYDFDTPLTDDVTIEGKYVKISAFTVKFNSDGGSKVANQTINSGDKVVEPTNVTKEGYILNGWYLNNKKYDFNTEVTKNITLVAKWDEDSNVKRYEVKFDTAGGNKISSQRVIENKTAKTPENPTRDGYAFEGWYLNDKEYDFKTKITKDITIVAKWEKVEKYTITFDTKGGSNIATQTVIEGKKVAKPNNPTKTGYKFVEWQLNGVAYDFNKIVAGDITLIAIWKDDSSYTITATRADNYSPDSLLKVFKNGKQISVQEIKYGDGVHLCYGDKLVVGTADIANEKTFIVVLNDGSEVKATLD